MQSKYNIFYPQTYVLTVVTFIHSVFCLTTGPKPPPKRCLHIVRSRASSFKWEYPLLSLRSSSSFLRLLPCLLATSISPFIFPSITCFRRQFLHKMWPIQLAFLFLISCRIFLCSLTLSNTSSFLTWSVQLIFSILLQHHISKLSRYFWSAARNVHSLHETCQLPCVQWITPDDRYRRCPKHVEFHDKINFGYLMHLVGCFVQDNNEPLESIQYWEFSVWQSHSCLLNKNCVPQGRKSSVIGSVFCTMRSHNNMSLKCSTGHICFIFRVKQSKKTYSWTAWPWRHSDPMTHPELLA